MGVTPSRTGKYGKPWKIPLYTDSGPDDITGLVAGNFSITIKNMSSLVETVSSGAITIVTANPAVITWQPMAADVATAGYYNVIVGVQFSTGPDDYDPIPWVIAPS